MYEFIKEHQLTIMLLLCGACAELILLLMHTRFLSKSRKRILILMEVFACFLLWFDRQAYIYAGDPGDMGYVMVRISNFIVFFLTPGMLVGFTMYVRDWLKHEGKMEILPKRLTVVLAMSIIGMVMAGVSAVTDLYYYFDEFNRYQRGRGFLIAYIIPVLGPILVYTVVHQYRRVFGRLVYVSLLLYIFVPVICGIIQIKAYGISIVNMSMVAVSVSLYVLMYLDLNDKVIRMHDTELRNMRGEQNRMKRLFDQTAMAFVSAVEKRDDFSKGNAVKIAEYAKKIAQKAGKDEEYCEQVYYAALLHDVGLIGIPDNVIQNAEDPDKWDAEEMRKKPLIGAEILSSITEYPYLGLGARYSHERFDGTGYPEGLKGESIPEIARIIAVADAYVTMTTKKRYRDARPGFVARENFVKAAGDSFDPVFADIMVKIIDMEGGPEQEEAKRENEIVCREYRENVSLGIAIENDIKQLRFTYEPITDAEGGFSAPSIILFDSYDKRTHNDKKTIDGYHYLEYGEFWFDPHSITTAALKIEERELGTEEYERPSEANRYEIRAGRYEDHVRMLLLSKDYAKEVVVALQNGTKATYIGLTGENCRIYDIRVEDTGKAVGAEDIPRIAAPISYLDHLEGDLKNIQIDKNRSASTEGVEIKNGLKILFHTMSLPGTDFIWDCPYIVLYYSDDGQIDGPNYRQYEMIKLNGENNGTNEYANNHFTSRRKPEFPGWEKWKEINKKGMECEVSFEKKGNRIILKTENLGISIENTTIVNEEMPAVYVSLTGDQVALTDIRVRYR